MGTFEGRDGFCDCFSMVRYIFGSTGCILPRELRWFKRNEISGPVTRGVGSNPGHDLCVRVHERRLKNGFDRYRPPRSQYLLLFTCVVYSTTTKKSKMNNKTNNFLSSITFKIGFF